MLTIDTLDEGVIIFTWRLLSGTVEGIADMRLANHTLYLDGLHLQGADVNRMGRGALWECARALGRRFQAHTVVIQGGRRTTGKTKGKIPHPITIAVP